MAKTRRVEFKFDNRSLANVDDLKQQGHFDMSDSPACSSATVPASEAMQSHILALQEKYEADFMAATEHYRASRCEVATKILDERVAILGRAMNDLTILWEQSMGFRD